MKQGCLQITNWSKGGVHNEFPPPKMCLIHTGNTKLELAVIFLLCMNVAIYMLSLFTHVFCKFLSFCKYALMDNILNQAPNKFIYQIYEI